MLDRVAALVDRTVPPLDRIAPSLDRTVLSPPSFLSGLASMPHAHSDAELDRRLRALSGRAARCRIAQGWLAARMLARKSWLALGFVRIGDYAGERLGLGARVLEEDARVVRSLRGLPRITTAFLEGRIPWTAVRLLAGIAIAADEDTWIAQAVSLDTRALSDCVRRAVAAAGGTGEAADSRDAAGSADVGASPDDRASRDAAASREAGAYPDAADNPHASVSPHAADSRDAAALRSLVLEDDEDAGDPRRRWTIGVPPRTRRLWRSAVELASRVAGARLTTAQVLEQVAAEALGGAPAAAASPRTARVADLVVKLGEAGFSAVRSTVDAAGFAAVRATVDATAMSNGERNDARDLRALAAQDACRCVAEESRDAVADPCAAAADPCDTAASRAAVAEPCAAAAVHVVADESRGLATGDDCPRIGLADRIAVLQERDPGGEGARRLGFLTVEDARDLEARDPQLASFFAELLDDVDDGGPRGDGDARDGASRKVEASPPPKDGWFEDVLRDIGHAEGFEWLRSIPVGRPSTAVEAVEAEMRFLEDGEPHVLDARLREVRGRAQAMDFELAALLDQASVRRLHRMHGISSFARYVEDRLGLRERTAWSLLSIGRAVGRSGALLGEAWRSGRLTTLAVRALLPVVGRRGGAADETDAQWIARAATVTLRRLEAEVAWALDRRDEAASGATPYADAPDAAGLQMRAPRDEAATAGDAGGLQMRSPTTVVRMLDETTGLQMRAPSPAQRGLPVAPPPLDLDLSGHALAAVTAQGLQMRAQARGAGTSGVEDGGNDGANITITVFAPESVIRLVEDTLESLKGEGESRARAFERMLALAMLEWMSAPRHRDPVFERDGWACAVPGCRSRRNLHDHHVVFRSHGGGNARDNRITVCAAHHLYGLHRGRIRARGLAPHAMEWELGIRFGYGSDAGTPLARLVGDRYVDRG